MRLSAAANSNRRRAYRTGVHGALTTLAGVVLSGPLALLFVNHTHPQPAWGGSAAFARSYHPVQTLSFLFGFLLLGGFVLLVASLHAVAREAQKARATAALVFVAIYAALVSLNYVVQTTFVPEVARRYQAADGPILAAFSMSNPTSLAWAMEMWGYGFLGVATWLVAPVFRGGRLERAARRTFVANGPVSIVPAVWTAAEPGWILTSLGLISFVVWNVLALAMALLAYAAFRRRTARRKFANVELHAHRMRVSRFESP
jgi:hypothetical protein